MEKSKDYCESCGRKRTWGCGHTAEDEKASRKHRLSQAHLNGECGCFDHTGCDPNICVNANVSIDGYAAFIHHKDAATYFANLKAQK